MFIIRDREVWMEERLYLDLNVDDELILRMSSSPTRTGPIDSGRSEFFSVYIPSILEK